MSECDETIIVETESSTVSEVESVSVVSAEIETSVVSVETQNEVTTAIEEVVSIEIATEGVQGPQGAPGLSGGPSVEINANCLSTDAVGDCVYVTADSILGFAQVAKVDPTDIAKMPAIGIVKSKSSPTVCVVHILGILTAGPFIPQKRYFVGTSGNVVDAPPIIRPIFLQQIGVAIDSSRLSVSNGAILTKLLA